MSSILHSKFLVHWTGGGQTDFHNSHCALNDDIRNKYVDRLLNTLQLGFFMKRGNETIWGANNQNVTASISRVCFTEIKLSLAKQHAGKYGLLGIGVSRHYVLERFGGPVFYVQNGRLSNVVENFHKVSQFLLGQPKEVRDEFSVLTGYLKNMSERDNQELLYYDEMEWRVVHLNRLDGKYVSTQDPTNFIYRLLINPTDIKVIVFPDSRTKTMALQRPDLHALIDNPIFVTLEECENF